MPRSGEVTRDKGGHAEIMRDHAGSCGIMRDREVSRETRPPFSTIAEARALNPFWGTALAAEYKFMALMALPSHTQIRESGEMPRDCSNERNERRRAYIRAPRRVAPVAGVVPKLQ